MANLAHNELLQRSAGGVTAGRDSCMAQPPGSDGDGAHCAAKRQRDGDGRRGGIHEERWQVGHTVGQYGPQEVHRLAAGAAEGNGHGIWHGAGHFVG